MGIKRAEIEVRDLNRLWDDLSWWERDESIGAATRWATNWRMPDVELEEDLIKRSYAVLEEVKQLDAKNADFRPSTLRSKLGLVPDEGLKPNFHGCMHRLFVLSNDDLVALGEHLGMPGMESIRDNRHELLEIFFDVGGGGSLAMFYAFRNILGKYVRL